MSVPLWRFLLVLMAVGRTVALPKDIAHNLAPARQRFSLFNNMGCTTCEEVMSIVAKQLPNAADVKSVSNTTLKLAITGACTYYTLAIPLATPLCKILSDRVAEFMIDDVLGRTYSINPKSNCRSVGLCPPCNVDRKRIVMAQKSLPNLPLPWDTHNKHMHAKMLADWTADQTKKRQAHYDAFVRNLTPARQKTMMETVKCYSCKTVLGSVGHDISNVRTAGRDLLVKTVKSTCVSYAKGMPFSNQICDLMAEKMVGNLADDIMGKGEIVPAANCRSIKLCPPCPAGQKCDDDEEIAKGKEAAKKGEAAPLPNVDGSCDEPPPSVGVSCSDNQDRCKSGETNCATPAHIRMMRMQCMFTCVCSYYDWVPGWGK